MIASSIIMALDAATLAYLDTIRWLRRCRPLWTRYHIRCIAARADDGWRALWTEIVLTDPERGADLDPPPPGLPEGIAIISAVQPIDSLPRLLRSVRAGALPPEIASEPIRLSWRTDGKVHVKQFSMNSSPQGSVLPKPLPLSRWWAGFPHAVLDFDPGIVHEWASAKPGRHAWLSALDDRARRTGCRGFFDLGARFGFFDDSSNTSSISNLAPFVRLVAPYLTRIRRARCSRETGQLRVTIERSTRLCHQPLSVTLFEHHRLGHARPALEVERGSPAAEVTFEDAAAGYVELRLHDDILDTFSLRQSYLRGRFLRSVRSALGEIFREFDPLRTRLMQSRGRDLQGPIQELLGMMGVLVKPIDGVVSKRVDLPQGVAEFDLLVEQPGSPLVVAIECTSDWCGPDKLGKVVARAKELTRLLQKLVAPEELSRVQPALAVSKERALAAKHLLESARDYGVGVIALEDMLELLDLVKAGELPARVMRRFAACFPSGLESFPRPSGDEIDTSERWDDENP